MSGDTTKLITIKTSYPAGGSSTDSSSPTGLSAPSNSTTGPLGTGNGTFCIDSLNLGIDREKLEYSLLILGVLSIIVFCFLTKRLRKSRLCHCGPFRSRPGLAYPVELIEETQSRFSHVAAFCITTTTILKLVFGQTPFGWTNIIPWLKSLVKLAVGLIYGLIYYPIFASLSSKTAIGYALGSIYTWFITATFIATNLPCYKDMDPGVVVVHVLSNVPVVVLSAILCVYLPYKFVHAVCSKYEDNAYYKDKDIPPVKHVKYLLKKRKKSDMWDKLVKASTSQKAEEVDEIDPDPPPKLFKDKATRKVKDMFVHKVYASSPGFRYSLNILSAGALSWLVAFILFCQFIYIAVYADSIFARAREAMDVAKAKNPGMSVKRFVGLAAVDFMTDTVNPETVFWRRLLKGCFYSSIVTALLLTFYSVLMVMKSYKRDLLLMYKGIYLFIPRDITKNPASLTVKATKFLGYQVAYAASGYVVMTLALLFLTLLVTIFTTMVVRYENYDLLTWFIVRFVIPFAIIFVISKSQQVLVTLCFLRKNDQGKKVLALDNRRFFHNFQFFMVYMNAAIGVISCIIMIAKSVFLGIWTIPRLDVSAFPRRYERFDSSFSSYCAMLEWDKSLRNPSMVVFSTLMLESVRRRNKTANNQTNPHKWKEDRLRYERASNKWGMLMTLLNNPGLMVYRQKARETRAKLMLQTKAPSRHAKNYHFAEVDEQDTGITYDG